MASVPEFEVIVVGAGIMGASAAYFLSKTLGSKVLLLEQFDSLHKRGSSHGESRVIRMTYSEEFNTLLMPDAYKIWGQIEQEAKTKLLTKTGSVCLGRKTNAHFQMIMKNMKKFDIPYTILSPEGVKEKFPAITLNADTVAIYSPDGGILNATKALATIQNLAKQNGCTFMDNCPVTKIQQQKNAGDAGSTFIQVQIKDGRMFTAKKIVLAAGAWTGKLVQDFNGTKLPLQPSQTTIAYWKVNEPILYNAANFPVFMNYGKALVYGFPVFEYPNLIKCASDEATPCDPDQRTFEPGMNSLLEDAAPFLEKHFKGVASKPSFTESCMYTLSPDGQFIIDVLPNAPNVIVGCGFSGHGFKLAPVVGKILADLAISGKHPYPHVHPHFTLQRFRNLEGEPTFKLFQNMLEIK